MKLIFLSGNAKSGKDLFADNACKFFRKQGLIARKFALANALKNNLEYFVQDSFGFSSFTNDPEKKELIRPIMISYGMAKRKQTNGKHWISQLSEYIIQHSNIIDVGIVTDIRFAEYEDDELSWAKKSGKLVFIERILENGEIVPPVCKDEEVNHPIIKHNADLVFQWKTSDNNLYDVEKFLIDNPKLWSK